MTHAFLPNPPTIRAAIVEALQNSKRLDMAVAFVGSDWVDILGSFDPRRVRLICWLSSTNTNPLAIRQMIACGVKVRHAPSMHAKVYLLHASKPLAVVGSANLSRAALADHDAGGQHEAAVLTRDKATVATISSWFERLWKSDKVQAPTLADLERAELAWVAARKHKPGTSNPKSKRASSAVTTLAVDWSPSIKLRRLADQVRDLDLGYDEVVGNNPAFVQQLDPESIDRASLARIIPRLARWTGHPGAYAPVLDEPLARVRRAFSIVFDERRPLDERLRLVAPGGSHKLAGLGLAAWTLLLSWRWPIGLAPFDRRTKRFLKDFKLRSYLRKTLSPAQYHEWIGFAQDVSARLMLPSVGHVDRMVWAHTRDLQLAR